MRSSLFVAFEFKINHFEFTNHFTLFIRFVNTHPMHPAKIVITLKLCGVFTYSGKIFCENEPTKTTTITLQPYKPNAFIAVTFPIP